MFFTIVFVCRRHVVPNGFPHLLRTLPMYDVSSKNYIFKDEIISNILYNHHINNNKTIITKMDALKKYRLQSEGNSFFNYSLK